MDCGLSTVDCGLHWLEAQAMEWRRTPLGQGKTVPRRPIAFVFVKGVVREQPMVKSHEAIAGHLRHDRSAGDDAAERVSVDDGPARQFDARNDRAVDQDHLWLDRKIADGAAHRQQRRLQDVVAIDFLGAGQPDSHMGATEDRLEGVRAFNEKRKPQFKGR